MVISKINPFPANCGLFVFCLYCKQYGPRSDSSLRSSLIWVHNGKSNLKYLEYIWLYTEYIINRQLFQAKKYWQDKGKKRK